MFACKTCEIFKNTYFEEHLRMAASTVRSSRPEVFCKKGVLRNVTKFTGKHLCQSLFFNKVAGPWHRCFPGNFVKFLRTFLKRTPLMAASVQSVSTTLFNPFQTIFSFLCLLNLRISDVFRRYRN